MGGLGAQLACVRSSLVEYVICYENYKKFVYYPCTKNSFYLLGFIMCVAG